MTHHTDERATLLKIERSLMERSLDEWVMETGAVALNSSWHGELAAIVRMAFDKGVEVEQAARRAPAAPVPQGWKMVPVEPTREMIDAMPPVEETGYWAMYEAALAAAPQPPEAAPHALQTERGLIGENPASKPVAQGSVSNATLAAPMQMPEPAGCVVYANGELHHWDANRECAELFASSERSRGAPYAFTFENLYTEQQVRQLLADNGIGKDKA